MSPEKSQYIWRKTIPQIEVGMGSGVSRLAISLRKSLSLSDLSHVDPCTESCVKIYPNEKQLYDRMDPVPISPGAAENPQLRRRPGRSPPGLREITLVLYFPLSV